MRIVKLWVAADKFRASFVQIQTSFKVKQSSHHIPKRSSEKPRSSHPEVFLGKAVLKIYSKFTGEHPCRSTVSIKLQSNFIEIALGHGCSPVNLLHSFRIPLPKNTSGWLLYQNRYFTKHAYSVIYFEQVSL